MNGYGLGGGGYRSDTANPDRLYFGDNLGIMRALDDKIADLIYLDPPFNSNANYNMIFKSPDGLPPPSQIVAFDDTWEWTEESSKTYDRLLESSTEIASLIRGLKDVIGINSMLAYVTMMAIRLIEMRRLLKENGNICLHCDPVASHYIKIVMDAIFGTESFKNELVWLRAGSKNKGSQYAPRKFGSSHDIILFYAKNPKLAYFDPPKIEYSEAELHKKFPHVDERGRYNTNTPIFREPSLGARPNLCYTWKKFTNPHPSGWRIKKETLEEMYKDGKILIDGDTIKRKAYLHEYRGNNMNDVWADIPIAGGKERLQYPTQKPLALLERIILATTKEGGLVLDPFCGCGTAVHAAEKLRRHWIGIDVTPLAIRLIEKRMKDAFSKKVNVQGIPASLDSAEELARRDPFKFELWAVSLIPHLMPNKKQVGDGGIDGKGYVKIGGTKNIYELPLKKRVKKSNHNDVVVVASVKSGKNLNPGMIQALDGAMKPEDADMGIFISLYDPTKGMKQTAAEAGIFKSPLGQRYPRIQIYTIKDYFAGRSPKLPILTDYIGGSLGDKIKKARGTQTHL